jgi:DNA-binding NtrC family response regulator
MLNTDHVRWAVDTQFTLPPTKQERSSAPLGARLTAVFPFDVEWQLELTQYPVIVGRETDGGVPGIANRTVSRRHAGVSSDGHVHFLRDVGARTPVRLDGKQIDAADHVLDDGAVIQLGDVFLVYEHGVSVTDDGGGSRDGIPGRSGAARRLRAQVARAAPDPSPVLLLGEPGTGKEAIARELHRLAGRSGAFVALHCAVLDAKIVDVFRDTGGGTVFLDEIGELSLPLQAKLLGALDEHQGSPVRLIAATSHDLGEAIEQNKFRRDLYSRLALWEIPVPPLRERRVDILMFLRRMLEAWSSARSLASHELELAPDAIEALLLHPWPDNLRGVDRLVHLLQARTVTGAIALGELPSWLRGPPVKRAPSVPAPAAPAGKRAAPTAAEFVRAFEEHAGNVRALSRYFDRDRRQIYRWMTAYGLKRKDGEED